MAPPDWLARPRQRLPRTVTPFHDETVFSFVRRLAAANRLRVPDLTTYLAGAPKKPVRPDWTAIASGWPLPVLAQRIRGLEAADQAGRHSGTACRRCMARRRVFEPVVVCRPRHANVCLRHQLWINGLHRLDEQLDLSDLPDVIAAQRAHNRLARRHGAELASSAFGDASHVIRRWTEQYNWPEHRDRRLKTGFARHCERVLMNSVELDVANYPETVALAGLLASEHWRHKLLHYGRWRRKIQHGEPSRQAPGTTEQEFYAEVGRRLDINYQPRDYDPLCAWIDHIRRSYLLQKTNHPAGGNPKR